MPIESVYNSQVRTIRRKLGNAPDLTILADEQGNVYFQDNPALGLVWVRRMQANGTYGKSFLVRGPTKPIKMIPGFPVVLGIDSDNVQRVMDVDFASIQQQGANPLQSAAVDPNTNNQDFVNQQFITTFFAQVVDGTLKVGIRGWLAKDSSGTWYKVEGQADFTGNVPTAGQHCLALISVANDYSTIEVQYSTAKDIQTPLDLSDVQEAWNATTATNYANSGWDIGDGQATLIESNRWADLRQFLNTNESTDVDYYQTVQDNGTPKTQRAALNFIGATVADDAGNNRTNITITSGSGDVVGPASAVDNDIAVFDGVTGKLIKDSSTTLSYVYQMSMAIGWFVS